MKKIFLVLALVCFISMVNAMDPEPWSKEEFKTRMDYAITHNEEQTLYDFACQQFEDEAQCKARQDSIIKNLQNLKELKEQVIKEYNEFFDAYHVADSEKTHQQQEKLELIFNEMNPLMSTIIAFEGIYLEVFYWTIHLDDLIKRGIIDPDSKPTDPTKPIKAVKGVTVSDNPITDCCVEEPESECCKLKKQIDQPQPDLLIPIVVGLIIIVFGVVYAIFIRKN
ncbi:hypothetical protein KKG83_02100 [Candidatus Micrarchaeota archaeon]|nr:hypothetical protein [Candidatus Micrarchaeota archaeon]MBU2476243.1 hypothetical protein [Candidatus Micrarchaeota archaeon]